MTIRALTIATSLIVATAGLATATSSGEDRRPTGVLSNETVVSIPVMTPLSEPVSLQSALGLAARQSPRGAAEESHASGFRFESDTVVGEYWVTEFLPPEAFLEKFATDHGTEPEVVGLLNMVEMPLDEVAALKIPKTVEVADAAFDAPPAQLAPSSVDIIESLSAEKAKASSRLTAASLTWLPTDAYVNVINSPLFTDAVEITQVYTWYSTDPFNGPYLIPDHWGAEFQVDITTELPQYQMGTRPSCWPDYETAPSIVNDNFTWWAQLADGTSVNFGETGAAGFYGDYFDLLDECRNNSLGVGVADPAALPSDAFSTQSLVIKILAGKGNESQSRVTGLVHAAERYSCEQLTGHPLTLCMGLDSDLAFPGPGQRSQPTKGWGSTVWYAPERCWYTPNFGEVAIDMGCEDGP